MRFWTLTLTIFLEDELPLLFSFILSCTLHCREKFDQNTEAISTDATQAGSSPLLRFFPPFPAQRALIYDRISNAFKFTPIQLSSSDPYLCFLA
jgi:hypothetical protein